jgi:putative Mg2+ transporter-C (MgtC) family protein
MITSLSPSEMLLRILTATVAGALVGLERETHGRPAGLRTTMLTCVASAIAMVISESLFLETADSPAWRPDPARLGAGILTGIGFLGAGTIMRHSNIIRGVTTAASLWFVTVLGLAFGSGLYLLGGIGLAIAMITLLVLPKMERHIPSDWHSTVTVVSELDALTDDALRSHIEMLGLRTRRLSVDYNLVTRQNTTEVEVQLKRRDAVDVPQQLVARLRQIPGVREIRWH